MHIGTVLMLVTFRDCAAVRIRLAFVLFLILNLVQIHHNGFVTYQILLKPNLIVENILPLFWMICLQFGFL